jgi:hypothetical protein
MVDTVPAHAYLFRIPRERQTHPLPGPTPSHERVFPIPDWVGSLADSSSTSSSASTSQGRHGQGGHRRNPFRRMRRWSIRSRDDEEQRQRQQQQHRNDSQEQIQSQLQTQTQLQRQGKQRDIERDGGGGIHVPIPESKTRTGATGGTGARLTSANLRVNTQAQAQATQYRTAPLAPTPIVQPVMKHGDDHDDDDDISWWFAIGLLTAMTALAGVTAEFLVDSIDGLVATGNVSREFVGLILLPVIGEWHRHYSTSTVLDPRYCSPQFCSILHPPSSILHPPSSNHDSRSSILNPLPRKNRPPLPHMKRPPHPPPKRSELIPRTRTRQLGRTRHRSHRLSQGQAQPLHVNCCRLVDPGVTVHPARAGPHRLGYRAADDAVLRCV